MKFHTAPSTETSAVCCGISSLWPVGPSMGGNCQNHEGPTFQAFFPLSFWYASSNVFGSSIETLFGVAFQILDRLLFAVLERLL